MQIAVKAIPYLLGRSRVLWTEMAQVLCGSILFAGSAQMSIPLYPIPLSLQTLVLFLLAIMQGGKRASLSIVLYLVGASMGLPLLAGGMRSNPAWISGMTGGYLLAFPIAAYVIGTVVHKQKNPSPLWIMMSILCGQGIIYLLGALCLSFFVGLKLSFSLGVLPFLPLAGLKLLIASSVSAFWVRWKQRFLLSSSFPPFL